MEFKDVLSSIDSYGKTIKFCSIVFRILGYCNDMNNHPMYRVVSLRDVCARPISTEILHNDVNNYEVLVSFNHFATHREPTCITENNIEYSPDCGLILSDGTDLDTSSIPKIYTDDEWFQYSTVYSPVDLLCLTMHEFMLYHGMESFFIDTEYFSTFAEYLDIDLEKELGGIDDVQ